MRIPVVGDEVRVFPPQALVEGEALSAIPATIDRINEDGTFELTMSTDGVCVPLTASYAAIPTPMCWSWPEEI